jgi:hypothetical protein
MNLTADGLWRHRRTDADHLAASFADQPMDV